MAHLWLENRSSRHRRPRGSQESTGGPIFHSEPYPYPEHIMYEYRFNENRIERWPLDQPRYPNSAESNSPPLLWESAGSSPEYLVNTRTSSSRSVQTTSPVSVISYHHQPQQPRVMRRSALRQHGRPPTSRKAKSVQWVSDIKKKPQDISSDRKIVKSQVLVHSFFYKSTLHTCRTLKSKKV